MKSFLKGFGWLLPEIRNSEKYQVEFSKGTTNKIIQFAQSFQEWYWMLIFPELCQEDDGSYHNDEKDITENITVPEW